MRNPGVHQLQEVLDSAQRSSYISRRSADLTRNTEVFSEAEPHQQESRDRVKSKVVVAETAVPVRADKTPKKKEVSSTQRKEETTSAATDYTSCLLLLTRSTAHW